MKKVFILFFLFIAITSCDRQSKTEKAVEEIPMSIQVQRFEKTFYETKPEDFPALRAKYPRFFTGGDDIWIERLKNPMWRELYNEVQKKYGNFGKQQTEIEELFKHVKYYFPTTPAPKVITVIGEVNPDNKIIYGDGLALISLELYLGAEHRFYQDIYEYQRQNLTERQMMPDLAAAVLQTKVPPTKDKMLISAMIYYGKELYMKDLLLPEYNDAEKIGYTPQQLQWCTETESYIWRYFIENKLLYDTDSKLPSRFITPAPFSKFYLEIDNDSPGRVGQWIGWQIVRSFMENNEISVQEMLKLDARELFERSRYKPKKIDEKE
jgi:gliding motility-associated lipoprotein GldB